MAQHEILLVVAPPLIVLGRPIVTLAWAFGDERRARVMRVLTSSRFAHFGRVVSAPLLIVLLHGLVVWLWHVPLLFEAALRNEGVHALQHASFFVTAVIFWLGHRPRSLRPRRLRTSRCIRVCYRDAHQHSGRIAHRRLASLVSIVRRTRGPLGDRCGNGPTACRTDHVGPGGRAPGLLSLGLFAAWLGEASRRVGAIEGRRRRTTAATQKSGRERTRE